MVSASNHFFPFFKKEISNKAIKMHGVKVCYIKNGLGNFCRCYTTANRSYLPSVGDFDAIVIHQRGIDWNDMPKKSQRRPEQHYVHWVVESAQYLYMDIHQLDNYFNWTMTYKKNSDFYIPYGRVRKIKDHPPLGTPELAKIIDDFRL